MEEKFRFERYQSGSKTETRIKTVPDFYKISINCKHGVNYISGEGKFVKELYYNIQNQERLVIPFRMKKNGKIEHKIKECKIVPELEKSQ